MSIRYFSAKYSVIYGFLSTVVRYTIHGLNGVIYEWTWLLWHWNITDTQILT